MFCNACTQLFDGFPEPKEYSSDSGDLYYRMHHPNAASFRRAKDAGCAVCTKSWRKFCLRTNEESLGAENVIVTVVALAAPLSSTKTLNALQFDRWIWQDPSMGGNHVGLTADGWFQGRWKKIRDSWYLSTGVFLLLEMVAVDHIDNRAIQDFGRSSCSPQSYEIVKEWMRSCVNDHLPQVIEQNGFFPDRVLDVGSEGQRIVRLSFRPAQDEHHASYATLSYCWGNGNHFKLETSTLERFQDGIDITELPKTMRDAVALTRELGLRFVWIDALCIIQDSMEDWRAQSALMGSIYRHSHINIAASASTSSEGGLFFDRDLQSVLPAQVTCRFPFDDITKPHQPYNILPQKPYYESIETAPLNARGWVMQERLLAPRTLHCAQDQLYWECEHMFANESHPNGIQTTLDRQPGEFRRQLKHLAQSITNPAPDLNSSAAGIAWLSLIREYTRCKLSKDEDILVACSGLAKYWNQSVPDQYLAGLWKRSLAEGLLWHCEAKSLTLISNQVCDIWRAPSWSWASYKGAVTWSENIIPHGNLLDSHVPKISLIQLVDTTIRSVSADQTGQLLRGSITIKAVLTEGIVDLRKASRSGYHNEIGDDETAQASMQLSIAHGSGSRHFDISISGREYTGFCFFDTLKMLKQTDRKRGPSMTCLPVLLHLKKTKNREGDCKVSIELEGIFVKKVFNNHTFSHDYRRIGYFAVSSEVEDEQTGDRFYRNLVGSELEEIASKLGMRKPVNLVLV